MDSEELHDARHRAGELQLMSTRQGERAHRWISDIDYYGAKFRASWFLVIAETGSDALPWREGVLVCVSRQADQIRILHLFCVSESSCKVSNDIHISIFMQELNKKKHRQC
jgi:hypothetical protein